MRVLILGDDHVLPRLSKKILPHNTFGFLIKKYFKNHGNIEVFIVANHINNTYFQSIPARLLYDFKQFEPDIVILNLGINDCMPRLLTKAEMIMINLRMIHFKNNNLLHLYTKMRYYLQNHEKNLIKKNEFKKNYERIIQEIIGIKSIPLIINLPKPPSQAKKVKSFYNLEKILEYNIILKEIAETYNTLLIDLFSISNFDPQIVSKNNLYLTEYGHQKLAQILIDQIENKVKKTID